MWWRARIRPGRATLTTGVRTGTLMAEPERATRTGWGWDPQKVLLVAAVFIIAYFIISIAGNAVTRYEINHRQEHLRREIAALEAQQARLAALKRYMESDEFVERAARDQGLVRPGDTVVIVVAPTPSPDAGPPPGSPWWERYFESYAR